MAQPEISDADFKTAVMAYLAISDTRAEKDSNERAPPALFYKGQRIIHLDDFALALHLTKKTIRKYRDDGLLEIFESVTGSGAFVTQDALDDFIDTNFISSRHPDYPKLKKKNNKSGTNTEETNTTKS